MAATARKQEPTAEEKAIVAAITNADAKLRRWEEALELSLEDAARRIKDIRREKAIFLETQTRLEKTITFQDRNPADSYHANG